MVSQGPDVYSGVQLRLYSDSACGCTDWCEFSLYAHVNVYLILVVRISLTLLFFCLFVFCFLLLLSVCCCFFFLLFFWGGGGGLGFSVFFVCLFFVCFFVVVVVVFLGGIGFSVGFFISLLDFFMRVLLRFPFLL